MNAVLCQIEQIQQKIKRKIRTQTAFRKLSFVPTKIYKNIEQRSTSCVSPSSVIDITQDCTTDHRTVQMSLVIVQKNRKIKTQKASINKNQIEKRSSQEKKNAKALERKVTPQTHYTQIVFSGYACSFDIHVVRMPVKSVVLNCVKRIYDREINITFVIAN